MWVHLNHKALAVASIKPEQPFSYGQLQNPLDSMAIVNNDLHTFEENPAEGKLHWCSLK